VGQTAGVSAAVEEAREPAVDALPPGFACPGCWYDLGGAERRVCPECGRGVVGEDLEAWAERSAARRALPGLLRAYAKVGLWVCVVMGLGACGLAREWRAGVLGGVLCAVALGGSLGTGWAASRLAPGPMRAVHLAAWVRASVWLHGPWLCMPVCAGVMTGLAVLGVPLEWMRDVSGVGFLAWLGLWVGVTARFAWVLKRERARLRLGKGRGWLTAAGVFILGGATLLGLAGGAFAMVASVAIAHGKWGQF
jgi:hypothetical protein